jgi:uncharacterized SAM-binding protein YcdF (DUF218 family)
VPPTSLLFLALAGLLIGRRIGRLLAWVGMLGLLILALPVVSGSLQVALEQNLPLVAAPDRPPQAIVILSGDVRRGGGPTPIVLLGPLSFERVRAGALLARRTGLPILVSGGRFYASDPSFGGLMADSLDHDFHVQARWVEDRSRDTWENARMSADILRAQGIRSIYLVTHAWHMRRAIVAFADTGITVTAAPTHFDRMPGLQAVDFVPTPGAWQASYYALHEWIGRAWYSLR